MKIRILQWILWIFLLPADILFVLGKDKNIIKADMSRYINEIPYNSTGILAFNCLMLINKPFRNIFYFRNKKSHILRKISELLIRPLSTIEIFGEIGEGFRISHNYAVIHPEKAGNNLYVGHGATIGKKDITATGSKNVYPVIGDNVSIYTNAVVLGGITIGNNVKIGAGAIVNKNVPDNCVVVGNPMRIIYIDKAKMGNISL